MRCTIRDLLWLTLLAAVMVAWWIDRWEQSRRIEKLEKRAVMFYAGDIDLLLGTPGPNPAGTPSPAP